MPAAGIRAAGIPVGGICVTARGGSLQQRAKRWTAPAADVWLNVRQACRKVDSSWLAASVPTPRRTGRSTNDL